jgi:hypothetical protein
MPIANLKILRFFIVADPPLEAQLLVLDGFHHLQIVASVKNIAHMWISPDATNKAHLRTFRSERSILCIQITPQAIRPSGEANRQ